MKTFFVRSVAEQLIPIYERMSDENLLSRMTTGGTQNANESFNNIVWVYCPKTVFVGYSTVLSAVQSAVVRFNAGSLAVTDKLKHLSIEPTEAHIACANAEDLERIKKVKSLQKPLSKRDGVCVNKRTGVRQQTWRPLKAPSMEQDSSRV